ncbi:hypothetical protein BSLG_004214 [Batrachochytrium salamandrivorans]|nr:hypothetical protein BSLG_004214 [Batrachochytrium salamandrivorans]
MAADPLSPGADGLLPQNKLTTGYPLYRKLSKILHLSLDEPETQAALAALTTIYPEHAAGAHRNLKSDVERQITGVSKGFLAAFDTLQKQLADIEEQIDGIGNRCNQMDNQLKSAYNDTASVLKHTQDMKTKSDQTLSRKLVAEALLQRFTLSDDEIRSLTTSNDSIDGVFFTTLSRVQHIQSDCKVLLITENQRLGLEIMETTGIYLESAFEKLYRWTLAECKRMKSESPEIPVYLKEGIRALKLRPLLFDFQDALSIGNPGGFPRPIEMHAHDALRYTGDILAWMHQAAVSEREMLEGLFDLTSAAARGRQMGMVTAGDQSALDEVEGFRADDESLFRVLNKSLEGICRPLKLRIESVFRSELGPITSYRVANLVQFYAHTILKVLGPSSELGASFEELIQDAFKVFFGALNAQAVDILRFVQPPGSDLQPPQAVKDIISQLQEIMLSYDGSLLSASGQDKEFQEIISALLNPVLKMCDLGSANLKPLESAMYMSISSRSVAAFSFAATQVQTIQTNLDLQVQVLVDEQYSVILRQSGLENLVLHMETNPPPLALSQTTDSKAVAAAMSRLDVFLVTVTVDVAETLANISSVQISRSISQRGFRSLFPCSAHHDRNQGHTCVVRHGRDTERVYTEVTREIVGRYGKTYDWTLKSRMIGLTEMDAGKLLVGALDLPMTPEEYIAERKMGHLAKFPFCKPLPGVLRLVSHLKKHNIPIVASIDLTSDGKPAPDIFLAAAQAIGNTLQAPRTCLVFEDSPAGVLAGLNAEMQVAWIPDVNMAVDGALRARCEFFLTSMEEFDPTTVGLPAFD